MILRKPYALLIKYFKLIHIIMFIITGILVFKLRSIFTFFVDYSKNGFFLHIDDIVNNYIPGWLFILTFIVLGACICIFLLMRKKEKPVLLYKFAIIYFIIVFVALFVYRAFFTSLVDTTYDSISLVWYRDIIRFIYYFNYIFVVAFFIRGFGFDIKKFSFEIDRKELDLEESDNEEFELLINFDKENFRNKLKKERREFRYYLKENAILLICILVIALGVIGYSIYNNKYVVNKIYQEGEYIPSNDLVFDIKDSVYTIYNSYGDVAVSNYQYIVLSMDIENKSDANITLNNEYLRIHFNDDYVYPINSNYFQDLGTVYNNNVIKGNSTSNYIFVFKIPIEKKFLEVYLEIKNGDSYKNALLNLDEDKIVEKEFRKTDTIEISGNYYHDISFNIKEYGIKETYSYEYQICNNDICNTLIKRVVPKMNNNIFKLKVESENITEDFLNYTTELIYLDGEEEKIIESSDLTLIEFYDNIAYFNIPLGIDQKNISSLVFKTRDGLYIVKLIDN